MNESERLTRRYFYYLTDFVCGDEVRKTYGRLLEYLYDTPFTYTIEMDGNREVDGIDLRYRFADENGISQRMIASLLDNRPCSVLEMMVALSLRCEEHIMADNEFGDRTGQWFWNMVVSLGVGDMMDTRFDTDYVSLTIDRFLSRQYKRNGEGGLFTLKHRRKDLRNAEIWYQAMWYLDEVLYG